MSGQSGGGQTQGGQGGQSQGQGGQRQGQSGQRQGQSGQRQGQRGQRSQGGAPGGGAAPRGGGAGGGGGADTTIIQEWAIFGTIMFALSGVGAGILAFLIDAIDQPVVELDLGGLGGGGGGGGNGGFGAAQQLQQAGGGGNVGTIALGGLDVLPVLAVFLAPFIGLVIARQVSLDDNTTFQAVGAATGAGTLVFLILGWFITSLALPSSLSIAFGGLIINAILAAIIAALVAIGGVWTQRNQSPTM